MAIAVALGPLGAVERLLDAAAHDELAGEDAHRRGHCLAHHRLAGAGEQPAQRHAEIPLAAALAQEPAGEHQGPGRGIDQKGVRLAEMAGPVGRCELVADQPVDRSGVGDAQQGLGEAHQRHALGRRERVLVEERVDAALAEPAAPGFRDEALGAPGDARDGIRRQRRCRQDALDRLGLVLAVGGAQSGAERVGARGRRGKDEAHAAFRKLGGLLHRGLKDHDGVGIVYEGLSLLEVDQTASHHS